MIKYKDSGVDWVGVIPEDWSVCKLKSIIETSIAGEVIDKSYWHIGEELLYTCQKTPMMSNFPNFPERKRTKKNDLLLTRNATPYVFIPKENSIYSNVVQKISLKKGYNIKFVKYCIELASKFVVVNGDTIPSYNMSIWSNLYLMDIPLKKQNEITGFLDEKCDKIDSLIKIQEEEIEQLMKYKYSFIASKTFGTEKAEKEIYNIPCRYKCVPIGSIFEIKKDIIGYDTDNVLSITQTGIKKKDLTSNNGQLAQSYENYQIVNVGDFAMNHMDLLTGWVDISSFEGVTSPDYRVFKLKTNDNPKYFLYIFQLYYKLKVFYGFGQGVSNLGRWRLPANNFLKIEIPVPERSEQDLIVEEIENKCKIIDDLIESKNQKLSELQTYKQSLIYEYVTGKKEI